MIPGEFILKEADIVCNVGKKKETVTVTNKGDRPIQVGSHAHFFEVNRAMEFDREKAFGYRLDIAAGTAVRFEPGEKKKVDLVHLTGTATAYGMNNLTKGDTNSPMNKKRSMDRLKAENFKNK